MSKNFLPTPTNKTSFNTIEVRTSKEVRQLHSKDITETVHSTTPPIGLNWLDFSSNANLRIRSSIDNVATDPTAKVKATARLDSWDDSVIYSAGCNWLDVCKHDRDFQFGTYAAGELSANPNKPSTPITFDRSYHSAPNVVVWFQDLDVSNSAHCRVRTNATDITPKGFTLTVEKWNDTKLYNARVSWIAYPASRSNIQSGNFDTKESRPLDETTRKEHSKEISFDKEFEGKPNVYIGLNYIDISKDYNLRVKAFATDVTAKNMTMHVDTWLDTVLYQASASWLAIQEC